MLEREHPRLVQTANDAVEDLRRFDTLLIRGRIADFRHDVFAERARSLSIYLTSALRLAASDEYTAAFAVLRAALEHQLTDQLLFLANRYRQQFTGVKKRDYEALEQRRAQKNSGTEDILSVTYSDGTMWIVRSGLHVRNERGLQRQTLSIFYVLLDQFDPFVGHPREQPHLSRGFTPVTQQVDYAEQQQERYAALRWPEIKVNLRENRLAGTETLRRLEVHYRFLSAFVHPVTAAYDLVYGRNRPTYAPRYDHYASELALLYVNKLAAAELRALKRMTRRTPRVGLRNWEDVSGRVEAADAEAAHLWWPGVDDPHDFDHVEEANSRSMRRGRLVPADSRPRPWDLKPHQIRYYRNPLRRLIRMHQSFQELTGFGYVSPWPREDAHFR